MPKSEESSTRDSRYPPYGAPDHPSVKPVDLKNLKPEDIFKGLQEKEKGKGGGEPKGGGESEEE